MVTNMNSVDILNAALDEMILKSGHAWTPDYFGSFNDEATEEANSFLESVISGGSLSLHCNVETGIASVCIR